MPGFLPKNIAVMENYPQPDQENRVHLEVQNRIYMMKLHKQSSYGVYTSSLKSHSEFQQAEGVKCRSMRADIYLKSLTFSHGCPRATITKIKHSVGQVASLPIAKGKMALGLLRQIIQESLYQIPFIIKIGEAMRIKVLKINSTLLKDDRKFRR